MIIWDLYYSDSWYPLTSLSSSSKWWLERDFHSRRTVLYIFSSKTISCTQMVSKLEIMNLEKAISQIYYECKDPDGFLYCKYASENFTGWLKLRAVLIFVPLELW